MLAQEFVATIRIEERLGRTRASEPVRVSVPFPRGLIFDSSEVVIRDQHSETLPHQCRVLGSWPDRSIRWLLVDALVSVVANESALLSLRRKTSIEKMAQGGATPTLNIAEEADRFVVSTGVGQFSVARDSYGPLRAVLLGSTELLTTVGSKTRLRKADGTECTPVVDCVRVEENGPVRGSILVEGGFAHGGRRIPLLFKSRLVFFADATCMRVEFQVRNPQAAHHPGGLWNLGDGGSYSFSDLSISLHPCDSVREFQWYTEDPGCAQRGDVLDFNLYQDSSGGENWDSPNHVDFAGKSTVSFQGFQVTAGSTGERRLISEGRRATPCLRVSTGAGWMAATTKDFWQNFPKALRLEGGALSIGVFPSECPAGFELQGGEQKRHIVFLDFGLHDRESVIPLMQNPLVVSVDPLWIEQSGAISWFAAAEHDRNKVYLNYMHNIVEGPNSFFRKHEVVDEYGWRNFGDLYADHEAIHHRGSKPLVSHYNNQYDFIYGALVQFLRTGDSRWQQLMEDAASTPSISTFTIPLRIALPTMVDCSGTPTITRMPPPALIEPTAGRTPARSTAEGRAMRTTIAPGCFTTTISPVIQRQRHAVLELANWVIAMDDGSRNLFGLIDSGPTGLASQTVSGDYHGPGRGAGNSINALLDAYQLCSDRRFVLKAEELIQRCIHPADDIQALQLDEPEYRWSYLVFLQVLGKYLEHEARVGRARIPLPLCSGEPIALCGVDARKRSSLQGRPAQG